MEAGAALRCCDDRQGNPHRPPPNQTEGGEHSWLMTVKPALRQRRRRPRSSGTGGRRRRRRLLRVALYRSGRLARRAKDRCRAGPRTTRGPAALTWASTGRALGWDSRVRMGRRRGSGRVDHKKLGKFHRASIARTRSFAHVRQHVDNALTCPYRPLLSAQNRTKRLRNVEVVGSSPITSYPTTRPFAPPFPLFVALRGCPIASGTLALSLPPGRPFVEMISARSTSARACSRTALRCPRRTSRWVCVLGQSAGLVVQPEPSFRREAAANVPGTNHVKP